jgi:DNA-binding transcriptional LysR family regulator
MQLVALKYFAAVADHGSFNAAAERLGVAPSTLTRSVNTLEDDLGLTLFERSRRGVVLTPGAASVLAETKRMLASLAAVTHIYAELTARRIDVALVPSFAPWPRIVMEPLYRERMVAAVPQDHALAGRDILRWSDLRDETIYVQEWPQSHAMREFYASMIGIGVPFQAQPSGKQTVFSLVAAGFGVTLAQQSQAEVSFPGVAFRIVDEANAQVEFSLAWPREAAGALIGRFLTSMRAGALDAGSAAQVR